VVDGDGRSDHTDRMIEVTAQEPRFIDGLVHLARGLGFSTGKSGEKTCVTEEGVTYSGFRVRIGGAQLDIVETVLPYQRFGKRGDSKSNTDHSCDGFTIEKVDHADYYGFTLDGNGRCLLGDFTVTHNSISATQKLLRGLDRSIYLPFMLAFSARTSANQTQDIIDGKLDRRRNGVLGPPPNRKCVIFVDDLNMPMREIYGAQPPIELLRQWMDYGGWYNRKTNTFTQIVDVQFVAAMGPPGGGRNPVSTRYLRHYNNICLTPYDDNSLKRIYSTIMRWWLEPFPAKVRSQMKSLVDATVKTYSIICTQLLPTPTKSHYTFNGKSHTRAYMHSS
jgi:dynein heavy chain